MRQLLVIIGLLGMWIGWAIRLTRYRSTICIKDHGQLGGFRHYRRDCNSNGRQWTCVDCAGGGTS